MTESALKPAVVDYGPQERRLRFLRHLRDNDRHTNEDLASSSGYTLDAVKSWFSNSNARRREIPDRAMALLLTNTGYTKAAYERAAADYEPSV